MAKDHPVKKSFRRLPVEAFFCAIFIYIILKIIQVIPLNADWFQPASNALKDFDWSDIYFSKIKNLHNGEAQNQDIVVINVENASRNEIARTLFNLNKANPKVVGLDLIFVNPMDSATDASLDSAIGLFGKNIIIACYADSTAGNNIYSLQPRVIPKLTGDENLGYVNFIGEENTTVRTYYKAQSFREKKMLSFGFSTFIKYNNQGSFNTYKDKYSDDETIIPYQSVSEHYTTIHYSEILDSSVAFDLFKNKIVLLGFAGSTNGSRIVDDMHFTPLNENYAGKALPDMYGVYIHANIIEGFISGARIYQPPWLIQWIACIVIIYLFLMLFLFLDGKTGIWQNLIEMALQLIFGFIIVIQAIYFLSALGMKWDIGEMIAAVALAEPLIGFYKLLIYFLGKVIRFNSIFKDEN